MDDNFFLQKVTESFKIYLKTDSRSNKKLKVLHGAISESLRNKLGIEYEIDSLDTGNGREAKINGKYIDKVVDITIKKNNKIIAGIGVKFVMRNYSQNSNNYFENMLGETVNIRCKKIPYFQIFIIPKKIPYYNKNGNIKNWEEFSEHNSSKYCILSNDDISTSLHTPIKTLLYVVKIPEATKILNNRSEYNEYYKSKNFNLSLSSKNFGKFGNSVIVNDYEDFINKINHYILFTYE